MRDRAAHMRKATGPGVGRHAVPRGTRPARSGRSKARRVVVIDWNAAAGAAGVAILRRAGHAVSLLVPTHSDKLRALLDRPPDAILIDLARRPAEGRSVGIWLRQRLATRAVPLVFVDGEPAKVARTRSLLPDAVYAEWRHIRAALRQAWRAPARTPIVRGTMDAYAGTPLPKKLGVRAAMHVALLGAPAGFVATLGELPAGVRLQTLRRGTAEMILLFAPSQAALRRRFPGASRALAAGGSIWILWRKQASGQAGDLGEKEVRAFGLANGFVDYKISAIDATWSGLRFARRRLTTAAADRRRNSRAR